MTQKYFNECFDYWTFNYEDQGEFANYIIWMQEGFIYDYSVS